MKNIKSIIILALLPILFYPVYFGTTNIIDSLLGDQQLINWITFDSRSILINIFFRDWLDSLPIMYAISFIILIPLKLAFDLFNKYSLTLITVFSTLIIIILSSTAGFEGMGLLNNAACMTLFAIIFHISIQLGNLNQNEDI